MSKPLGAEALDQFAHFGVGFMLSFIFATIGIPVLYVILPVGAIAIIREWIQHKRVFLPSGGSGRDVLFFLVGSAVFIVLYLIVRFLS